MSYAKCRKCGNKVDRLAMFPGGLCLECYRPEGDRIAKTMTAERLARMWGGSVRKTNTEDDE